MPRFWLCDRDAGRLVGVVIVESAPLIQARLNAAVGGVDAGATFAEGHEIGSDLVVPVAPAQIGRLLSRKEAEKLLARFEGRKPRRSKK